MSKPQKRPITIYPSVEPGDMRAFARALVAVARRVALEEAQAKAVVQSEPSTKKQAA